MSNCPHGSLPITDCLMRRNITLIESNAKCRYKKMTCKGTLRKGFICSNFEGSEFGQKQSVKLLQNMVSSTIQQRIIYLKYFLVFSFIEKRPWDYYPVQDSFDRFCSSIFGFLL